MPHHAYQGREEFKEHFHKSLDALVKGTFGLVMRTGGYILVTGVTEKIFNDNFLETGDFAKNDKEVDSSFSMACAWDPELELLLVILFSSGQHGSTSATFTTMLDSAVDPKLHNRRITPIRRATQFDEMGVKSPGASWVPHGMAERDKSRFPSVVMEIEYSDSAAKEKLQSDVRFWVQASKGEGNHIIITEPREGEASVDGDALTIDLEHILRRPSTDPAEGNTIENSVEELKDLAINAWELQEEN
ncbi:hypothetical protein BDV19DRAFT_385650 [Aspergillus venezuelensis]